MLSMEVRWPQGGSWLAGPSFLRHERKQQQEGDGGCPGVAPEQEEGCCRTTYQPLPTPLPTRKKLTGEKFSQDEGSKAGYQ